MTPLHRKLAAMFGPRLAATLLAAIYAALLVMMLMLISYNGGDTMIYLDTP